MMREHLQVSGTASIEGQFIVENGGGADVLVTENQISGNPTIIYDGRTKSGIYEVSGWREVR